VIKARELIVALGALAAEGAGPEAIILAPSVVGGVSLTFIDHGRDISICAQNDRRLLCVMGTCWFGALRVWDLAFSDTDRIVREVRRIFQKAREYDRARELL
jgi:hypothetical protein